jgi:hypothetical protein
MSDLKERTTYQPEKQNARVGMEDCGEIYKLSITAHSEWLRADAQG